MENENLPQEGDIESGETAEFDREKWEELKADKDKGTYRIFMQGMEMGVSQSELEIYFQEIIALKKTQEDYAFEFHLRRSLSKTSPDWGSPEEIRTIGEQAYQAEFDYGNFATAARLAGDLYGIDSPQYLSAAQAAIAEREEEPTVEEKQDIEINLSSEATIADLFQARDAIEEARGLGGLELEAELHDNFDADLVEDILSNIKSKEKVIDFFARYDRSKEDIEAFLPIKFV